MYKILHVDITGHFLVNVNDFPPSSKIINLKLADDANIFHEHKNII